MAVELGKGKQWVLFTLKMATRDQFSKFYGIRFISPVKVGQFCQSRFYMWSTKKLLKFSFCFLSPSLLHYIRWDKDFSDFLIQEFMHQHRPRGCFDSEINKLFSFLKRKQNTCESRYWMDQTLYSQCGLSAQNNMARASNAAGAIDTQKQTRHLNQKGRAYSEMINKWVVCICRCSIIYHIFHTSLLSPWQGFLLRGLPSVQDT